MMSLARDPVNGIWGVGLFLAHCVSEVRVILPVEVEI